MVASRIGKIQTGFLSAKAAARVVTTLGVDTCLRGIASRIEADFQRWPEFDKTARLATLCPEGVIELMPIADARTWSFKYVNGHPRNARHDRPTVMAFGALARIDTGELELLSELTLITALRTAAMSALVARRLARVDSGTMALIGNGAQSEFQAFAFHYLLGIHTLRLHDLDQAATRKLVNNLRGLEVQTIVCDCPADACSGADIITTATADASHAAIITPAMVVPGIHINAVGGDSPGKTELSREVLRQSKVFVEFEAQTRIEGEIQQMPRDFPVTEVWRVLCGAAPGRTSACEVTVFDSVGFALEDFSAMQYMRDQASALGLITPIDLVPSLADPKDLFSLIRQQASADPVTRDVSRCPWDKQDA